MARIRGDSFHITHLARRRRGVKRHASVRSTHFLWSDECECGNVLLLENVILACSSMYVWSVRVRRAGALLLNVIEQRPGVPASGLSPVVTKTTYLTEFTRYAVRDEVSKV